LAAAFFTAGLAAALAAGLAAALAAAAGFFAAGAALAAGFFTSDFLAAVAIFVLLHLGWEKFTHKIKTRPTPDWARRIIHRRKQRFALMNWAPS
jgi:membrane protein implicated in regulation of membrane protease activity